MTVEGIGLLVAAMGLGAAMVAIIVVVVRSRSSRGEDTLQVAVSELQKALAGREGALDARVSALDTKLASLQETVTSREAVLDQQVRGIGSQMQGIAALFGNDRARGGWGEISLLRIFELGGLAEGRDYTAQFHSGEGTPDAVVHLPGGRNIVIDSKFPLARFNEALAADDPEKRRRLLAEQGKELERVAKALIDRGYGELATGGYVVMYLPSQAVYEAAAEAHAEVIDHLLERRVVVTGPTTLFALLMNVASLVTEHRALRQADRILDEARELHRRMTVFINHLGDIGSALAKTVTAFNSAVGSWTNRVAPQLARVDELDGHDGHEPVEPVDEAVREVKGSVYELTPTGTAR